MPTLPTFCGKDCGGNACPLLATVENGRVTRIANNPAGDKYLKGCQRGFTNLRLETYAPERILTPLVRSGPRGSGSFRAASWDEALDLTAVRLGEIRARHGPQAVLNLSSDGSTGALHDTSRLGRRFLNLFGGSIRLTGNYSNGAARFVLPYLLGPDWIESGFDPATLQYSEMIILWGANVLEARLGSELPQRLAEARQRGAQIVVIDPRRSTTARQLATTWLPCRPGADAALMLAVLYVLLNESRVDRAFVAAHSFGFDELERYVLGKGEDVPHTPAWAAPICGLPEAAIFAFARAYSKARPAALLPGYAIQRSFAGEETYRLAVALQLATANFGLKGGSTGSMNNRLAHPRVGLLDAPTPPDQPGLPVLRWPDAILQGRAGGYPADFHAAYIVGGNLLNQGGDIRKNVAAFEKLDFTVAHELFLTPTACYCDVIFPAATALEKEDIGIPWAGNYLLYKSQVVQPLGEARSDYDILCDLADRLGFGTEFSEGRSAAQWIERFIAQSEVPEPQAFKQTGVYMAPEQERVGLSAFRADPVGHPLGTPSCKVEIASQSYAQATGFLAIPTWRQPPADPRYPLLMITPKSPHRTHSQGSGIAEIRARANHALEMHPADAAVRGIADGDTVRIFNNRGSTRVPVRLSDDLTPGVVCLPEGVWVELDGGGIDVAGSANMLTSTDGTAPSIAPIMHGIGVEVERVEIP